MTDDDFLAHIVTEICDYAVKNGMKPDETISIISENLKALLKISTFNGWKNQQNGGIK